MKEFIFNIRWDLSIYLAKTLEKGKATYDEEIGGICLDKASSLYRLIWSIIWCEKLKRRTTREEVDRINSLL